MHCRDWNLAPGHPFCEKTFRSLGLSCHCHWWVLSFHVNVCLIVQCKIKFLEFIFSCCSQASHPPKTFLPTTTPVLPVTPSASLWRNPHSAGDSEETWQEETQGSKTMMYPNWDRSTRGSNSAVVSPATRTSARGVVPQDVAGRRSWCGWMSLGGKWNPLGVRRRIQSVKRTRKMMRKITLLKSPRRGRHDDLRNPVTLEAHHTNLQTTQVPQPQQKRESRSLHSTADGWVGWWFSARLQYLQCISTGDTAGLNKPSI